MSYQINLGQWNSVFAVPSSVVDQHIKIASEAQLKVLLYLLRHADDALTEETLADALRLSKEEIRNALSFWIERGLLSLKDDTLVPADNVQESTAFKSTQPKEAVKKPRTVISRAQRPDSAFVSKLLSEDAYLSGLLEQAQTAFKKPLSPGDTATLVMLYNTFGLPCEVIAMLITHLVNTGSANMRSVERIGIRWADEGIMTVRDAEAEIGRMAKSREAWGRVSALLGIRSVGNPTKAQTENADRWLNTWQFSDEMITEAYERCVNIKNEFNMSYVNGILKRWHEKNIKSLDALRQEDAAAKNKPKARSKVRGGKGSVFSVEGASFDVSEYENYSIFDEEDSDHH